MLLLLLSDNITELDSPDATYEDSNGMEHSDNSGTVRIEGEESGEWIQSDTTFSDLSEGSDPSGSYSDGTDPGRIYEESGGSLDSKYEGSGLSVGYFDDIFNIETELSDDKGELEFEDYSDELELLLSVLFEERGVGDCVLSEALLVEGTPREMSGVTYTGLENAVSGFGSGYSKEISSTYHEPVNGSRSDIAVYGDSISAGRSESKVESDVGNMKDAGNALAEVESGPPLPAKTEWFPDTSPGGGSTEGAVMESKGDGAELKGSNVGETVRADGNSTVDLSENT